MPWEYDAGRSDNLTEEVYLSETFSLPLVGFLDFSTLLEPPYSFAPRSTLRSLLRQVLCLDMTDTAQGSLGGGIFTRRSIQHGEEMPSGKEKMIDVDEVSVEEADVDERDFKKRQVMSTSFNQFLY